MFKIVNEPEPERSGTGSELERIHQKEVDLVAYARGEIMLPKRRRPIHPGEILQEEFLLPLGITQEQLAKHLGGTWTQSKISGIVQEKRSVTESIALDFADAFGTTPEFWINLQSRYDLWIAQQKHKRLRRLPNLLAA